MKKTLLALLVSSFIYGLEMPPMPPMIPIVENTHTEKNNKQPPKIKNKTPKSCELIPPMVIFLPPPMEKEVVTCKNELFIPKKEFAQKQLEKLLKKKIKISKIEIVPKFNQLYKITYDGGEILTNKNVNAFIKQ